MAFQLGSFAETSAIALASPGSLASEAMAAAMAASPLAAWSGAMAVK